MPLVPTMAVQITDATYPVAVACLAGGFAMRPKYDVLGAYLIINELHAECFKSTGKSPILVLKNSWMDQKLFQEKYRWVLGQQTDEFAEVTRRL